MRRAGLLLSAARAVPFPAVFLRLAVFLIDFLVAFLAVFFWSAFLRTALAGAPRVEAAFFLVVRLLVADGLEAVAAFLPPGFFLVVLFAVDFFAADFFAVDRSGRSS